MRQKVKGLHFPSYFPFYVMDTIYDFLSTSKSKYKYLYLPGLVAYLMLTGVRINEVLFNRKYQTYLDIHHAYIKRQGRYYLYAPLTEKKKEAYKERLFPVSTIAQPDAYLWKIYRKYVDVIRPFMISNRLFSLQRVFIDGDKFLMEHPEAKYITRDEWAKAYYKLLKKPDEVNELKEKYGLGMMKKMLSYHNYGKFRDHIHNAVFPLTYSSVVSTLTQIPVVLETLDGKEVTVSLFPHLFRAWRASDLMLNKKFSETEVTSWIDHSSSKILREYYFAAREQQIEDALAVFERKLVKQAEEQMKGDEDVDI